MSFLCIHLFQVARKGSKILSEENKIFPRGQQKVTATVSNNTFNLQLWIDHMVGSLAGRKRSWRDRQLHRGEIRRAPAGPWAQTGPRADNKGEPFGAVAALFCCYLTHLSELCVLASNESSHKWVSASVMSWTSLFVFIARWRLLGSSIGLWPTMRRRESTIPRTSFQGSARTWNLSGRRMNTAVNISKHPVSSLMPLLHRQEYPGDGRGGFPDRKLEWTQQFGWPQAHLGKGLSAWTKSQGQYYCSAQCGSFVHSVKTHTIFAV